MAFGKISKQSLDQDRTVELVLYQLVGDPVLVVRHLGESNKPFWNDALAKAGKSAVGKKTRLTSAEVLQARAENRETVAKYSVVDLHGVRHDDGRPAVVDDISDVIAALPDDVFDAVLRFVTDPNNFRDVAPADPQAVAGK